SSDDKKLRELLRLLSMIEVLVTTSGADEQIYLNEWTYLSGSSDCLDKVAVDEYAMLNTHLWRVFVLSQSKAAVFPLVCSQLEVLTVSLGQSKEVGAHRRLCALVGELLQLAGEVFFDANRYTDAAHCYTLAAAVSKEAEAFDLWACALTRHAFIEIYERRFDKAAPMLELAERLARKGDESLSTRYRVSAVSANIRRSRRIGSLSAGT
ncbi:MAG: transcriptional regulator, partial [Pseudonocardiaceae bacterium]